VTQKRIYINANAVPAGIQWQPITPYADCFIDSLLYYDPKYKKNTVVQYLYSGALIPVDKIFVHPGDLHPIGYTGSSRVCVDCTLRGSNKQPDFWQND
jgi:hypothetical protein